MPRAATRKNASQSQENSQEAPRTQKNKKGRRPEPTQEEEDGRDDEDVEMDDEEGGSENDVCSFHAFIDLN